MKDYPLAADGTRIMAPGHTRCGLERVERYGRFDHDRSSTGMRAVCRCGAVIPLRVRDDRDKPWRCSVAEKKRSLFSVDLTPSWWGEMELPEDAARRYGAAVATLVPLGETLGIQEITLTPARIWVEVLFPSEKLCSAADLEDLTRRLKATVEAVQ